jgi:hypothetical protein
VYEAGVQSTPEPTQPTRPRKATLLAVLLMVFGGLGLLVSLLLLAGVNDTAGHGQSVPAYVYVLVYAQFLLSATQGASGFFVLRGHNWARLLAIGLCSLNIIGGLVSLSTGAIFQAISAVAINVALIRLLNDHEVQAWCDK